MDLIVSDLVSLIWSQNQKSVGLSCPFCRLQYSLVKQYLVNENNYHGIKSMYILSNNLREALGDKTVRGGVGKFVVRMAV